MPHIKYFVFQHFNVILALSKNLKAKFAKTAQNTENFCYKTGLESFCIYLNFLWTPFTSLTFPWTHHRVLEEAGLAAWMMIELAEALARRPGHQHLHLALARPLRLSQDLVQQVAAVLCEHLHQHKYFFQVFGDPDPHEFCSLKTGLRIRIRFIRIRTQHFRLNTNPDPDPGL